MTVEFRCRDVGVHCGHVTRADSDEHLVAAVAEHAKKAHGVDLTATLVDYARSRVRTTDRAGGR